MDHTAADESSTGCDPQTDQYGQPTGEERVEDLQEQVSYLCEQLRRKQDARREESRELRRIITALTSRIPELESPRERPEAPQQDQEEAHEALSRGT